MQLVIIVLNEVEYLEDLLAEFAERGIGGATILDSTGMARMLYQHEDLSMFGSLSMMFNQQRDESKTIFTVLPEDQVPTLKAAVKKIVGDISKPNTGIMFGVPVDFVDGLGGQR